MAFFRRDISSSGGLRVAVIACLSRVCGFTGWGFSLSTVICGLWWLLLAFGHEGFFFSWGSCVAWESLWLLSLMGFLCLFLFADCGVYYWLFIVVGVI